MKRTKLIIFLFAPLIFLKYNTTRADININNTNESKPNSVNNLKNISTQNASATQTNKITLPSLPALPDIQNYIKNYAEQSKSLWQTYKKKIVIYSLAGSYTITLFTLIRANSFLRDENRWSSWPYSISFENLISIPQKELFNQLMLEIEKKYAGRKNKDCFLTPLSKFLTEIEKEKNYLNFYSGVYRFLKKFHLIKLFPVRKKNFKKVNDKIKRLVYLKNIILSWSMHDNIKHVPYKNSHNISSSDKKYNVENIKVEVTNQFSPTSTNYLSNSTMQSVMVQSMHYINRTIPQLSSFLKEKFLQSTSFVQKYQEEIIVGAGIGLYATIFYGLIKGDSYLTQENLWSYWPYNLDFQKLVQMPKNEVEKQLLTEIQIRYMKANSPTDFITPLVKFMNDIEKEKKSLIFYMKLYETLSKIYISWIFPMDKKIFLTIKEKLERLSFIRNIFLKWAANYKIDQNTIPLQKEANVRIANF